MLRPVATTAAAAIVLASAAAAALAALPDVHAVESPAPHVFDAAGTVTVDGYTQMGYAEGVSVPVHGIQVCVYDLSNGTAGTIALVRLNTTGGTPACAYTDRGGAYSIQGVVGSDPHDGTRADVVASVLSRGYGGAVVVVGYDAGEYRLYRADSGAVVDYGGTLHTADFELGKNAIRTFPSPSSLRIPSADAGVAGAARIVSALSDGLSFFEGFGRAPADLAVWWQYQGGSEAFPREQGGGSNSGDGATGDVYRPDDDDDDDAVVRLDGGSGEVGDLHDDSRSRWAILGELARRVHADHNPGLGQYCHAGYNASQIGDKQDAACAWGEGWASLAPHLIDGRAAMAGPHGRAIDIEAATVSPQTADYGRPFAAFEGRGMAVGEKVPGRVAAAMWDMADNATDPAHDTRAAGGRDDIAAGTGRLLGVFFNGTYGSLAEFYDRWEIDMRRYSAERVAMLHGMSFAIPNAANHYQPAGRLGGLFGSGLAGLELVPNYVAVSADGSIVAVTSERGRGLQLVDVSGGDGVGGGVDGSSNGIGRHVGLYAARGHDYSCMLERDPDACMKDPAAFGSAGPDPGQFSSMDGVAFSPDGDLLLVTDGQWNRISMFGPDGGYVGHFGTPHLTAGPAGGPADLPLEGDGEFYCPYPRSLPPTREVHDPARRHCGADGVEPPPAERPVGAGGEFYRLGGVAFLPDGTAAVADGGNRRIRLLEIGGDGGGGGPGATITGQFASYSPDLLVPFTAQHIAADPRGPIYTAGSLISGLWQYTHDRGRAADARLVSDLSLGTPGGIAVDNAILFVSDRERGLVRAYPTFGGPINGWHGAPATGPYDPLGVRSATAVAEGPLAPRAAAPGMHPAGVAPAVLPAVPVPPTGPFPSHLGALPLKVTVVPSSTSAFLDEFGSPHPGPQQLAAPGGVAVARLDNSTEAMRVYVADPNGVMIYEEDRERPVVTRVWAHTPDGTLRPGDTAEIAVSFSERVTVSGAPVLPLAAGAGAATAQGAVYVSGSGSSTLTFNYTAGAGDGPGHLDNAGAGSLVLTEQEDTSIMDGGGNAADPALPARGTAASLAANAALWIAPDGGRDGNGNGTAVVGPFWIEPVPPAKAVEGREVRLAVSATSAAAAGSYSLSGAPAGATILQNGTLLWTPGEAQDGEHAFVVRAASAADPGAAHSRAVRIAVSEANEPPRIAPIPDMRVGELSELRFDVDAADPDMPAQRLEYEVGAGAPAGAAILPNGTFAWTPSARDAGVHEFNVSVSDGFGQGARAGGDGQGEPGTAFASFSVEVADVPQPPPSIVRVYQDGLALGGGGAGGGAGDSAQAGMPGWRALGLPSAYGAGDEIVIAVEFSAPVAVRGMPELQLDAGGGGGGGADDGGVQPALASYDSGSGTAVLRFKYVVAHGHDSGRLGYDGTGALSAGGAGGGIEAAASGEAADLALPAPGSPGSLSSTSRITVATVSPVVDIGVLDDRAPAAAAAYAAWMAAADFNARSDGPLLNVTVYPHSPAGVAGALRGAHAGGGGPELYVGRLGDEDLYDAMQYAADAGIVLVSTASSSAPLAVEGDRTFRLRPSDGVQADMLERIAREAGAESLYTVIENVGRGPGGGGTGGGGTGGGQVSPDRDVHPVLPVPPALPGPPPVSLDRDVYPVPFGTPADFAGMDLRGAAVFPIPAIGARDPGAAGDHINGGDLTIRVRIHDPHFDVSADSVDTIAVNVPRGTQDSRTPADQLGHGPLTITVSRGSSSVVVATAGAESANDGRISAVPAGGPAGGGAAPDGVRPGVTRELGPITEIAPDAGIFELELALRYTDGPAGPMCPRTAAFAPLGGGSGGAAAPDRGPGARFADGAGNHCILQGDMLTVEYADQNDEAGVQRTAADSAVFDLRNGALRSDRSVYVAGGDMVIELIEPDLNLDSGEAEAYSLKLIEWDSGSAALPAPAGMGGAGAAGGGQDPPYLRETGADTGIFRAVVTVPGDPAGDRSGSGGAAGQEGRAAPLPPLDPLAASAAARQAGSTPWPGQQPSLWPPDPPHYPLEAGGAAAPAEPASTAPSLWPPDPPHYPLEKTWAVGGDDVVLGYTDWGPSGAGHVGGDSGHVGLNVSVSKIGAAIELDMDSYAWTDMVRITAVAPGRNLDPNLADEIGVSVTTYASWLDDYRLVETGADTGVFAGEVVLTGFPYDADGDPATGLGGLDIAPDTSGTGPADGRLAAGFTPPVRGERSPMFDVVAIFTLSGDRTVADAAPIRWSVGDVQWGGTGRLEHGGTVRVVDPDMDLDPGSVDSFVVDVYSDSDLAGIGLNVFETGNATGVFEGTVSLTATGTSSGHRLRAAAGDAVTARYWDATTPDSYAVGVEASLIVEAPAARTPEAPGPGATIELDRDSYAWTDKVRITAVAPGRNLDPAAVDEIGATEADAVTISTRGAELGRYRLVETGADTGVFAGEVVLTGFPYDKDGRIAIGRGGIPAYGPPSGSGPAGGRLPTEEISGITASLETPDGGGAVLATATVRLQGTLAFPLGGTDGGAVLAAAHAGDKGRIVWIGTSHPAQGGIVRIHDPGMASSAWTTRFVADVYSDSDPAGIDLVVARADYSTGVFEGTVLFASAGESSGRCLRVSEGDTVTVEYSAAPPHRSHFGGDSTAARPFIGTIEPPFGTAPALGDAADAGDMCRRVWHGAGDFITEWPDHLRDMAEGLDPPWTAAVKANSSLDPSGGGPAAVVYLGSPEGLAALADASAAYPAMASARWLASDASAGSGLLAGGDGAGSRASSFAAQTGLTAARWSPPASGLAHEIDARLSGADLGGDPDALVRAYAAYDAVVLLGTAAAAAAAAAAATDGASSDDMDAAAVAGLLPSTAAAYDGALGDIALDPAGDLWVPALYELWGAGQAEAQGAGEPAPAPGWSRQPGVLDEARACSIMLERSTIDYGPIDPGQTSRPYRQAIENTGQLPFSEVGIAATPWHVDSPGGCAAGSRPSLPVGLSEIRTELGGSFADLAGGGIAVARGLEPGGLAPLWYRLSLAGVADMPQAEISQCVTYTVRC